MKRKEEEEEEEEEEVVYVRVARLTVLHLHSPVDLRNNVESEV